MHLHPSSAKPKHFFRFPKQEMPRSAVSAKKYSYTSPKSPVSVPTHNTMTVKTENPGFFSNVFAGFGLGAGQAVAHNIFRSDPVVKHVHEPTAQIKPEIKPPSKEYIQCIQEHNDPKDCEKWLRTDPIHHISA